MNNEPNNKTNKPDNDFASDNAEIFEQKKRHAEEKAAKLRAAQDNKDRDPSREQSQGKQSPSNSQLHSNGAELTDEQKLRALAIARARAATARAQAAAKARAVGSARTHGSQNEDAIPSNAVSQPSPLHFTGAKNKAPTASEKVSQLTRVTDIKQMKTGETEKGSQIKKKKTPEHSSYMVVSVIKAIAYIVLITVISVFISISIIRVGNDVFAFVKSDELVDINVPESATISDISKILYDEGVIKYPKIFRTYAKIKEYSDEFLSGTFTVSPSMNYETLIKSLKKQKAIGTSWITIPEGYTVDEIINLMVSSGIGEKEKYIDVINNYDFNYWFVDELEENGWNESRYYRLEGYLFPDTYEFYNSSSEVTVINKLLSRFNEVFADDFKLRAEELKLSVDEVVTIASIIEREAKLSIDYMYVSSVIHNRLNNPKKYPKLECDSTIYYAIYHDTGERPGELTLKDLDYESPYNTYRNDGLPPGAISNASLSAIRFALYPTDTNYYYFVSANSGVTYYGKTLAEHLANKNTVKELNND